jgi:GH43 family beta-xylosidase
MSERGGLSVLPDAPLTRGFPYFDRSFENRYLYQQTPTLPSSRTGEIARGKEIHLRGRAQLDTSLHIPYTENSEFMTFKNPILPYHENRDGDPWLYQKDGIYFYCHVNSGEGPRRISVAKSKTITGMKDAEDKTVYIPNGEGLGPKHLWAPELHYLQNRWFIHVAAPGANDMEHRMHVLGATTDDPQGEYEYLGEVENMPEMWAIDGHVFSDNQSNPDNPDLYYIFSGIEDGRYHDKFTTIYYGEQKIYIARMKDPVTILGDPVCIAQATEDWEKHSWEILPDVYIQEGPTILEKNGVINLIVMANHSQTPKYSWKNVVNRTRDFMNPAAWVSQSSPVYRGRGDGHPSFVKSPDGAQDWAISHRKVSENSGWEREIIAFPFTWNDDNTPKFPAAIVSGEPMQVPSGEEFIYLEEQAKSQEEQIEGKLLPQPIVLADADLAKYAAD